MSRTRVALGTGALLAACLAAPALAAEPHAVPEAHSVAKPAAAAEMPEMDGPGLPGRCEEHPDAAAPRVGCYFNAALELGPVSRALYWHIDEFPTFAAANAAERTTDGSIAVTAYGWYFLQTVTTNPKWRPRGSVHVATIGPLATPQGANVTARFMEAMTAPGATTRVHRHGGTEAFHVLTGAICLETPQGARQAAAGQSLTVAGGTPMRLTSHGPGLRRSLILVLHPSTEPWMTAAPDWQPRGTCLRAR